MYYDRDNLETFADALEREERFNQHEDKEVIHQEEVEKTIGTLDGWEIISVTEHLLSPDNISTLIRILKARKAQGSKRLLKR